MTLVRKFPISLNGWLRSRGKVIQWQYGENPADALVDPFIYLSARKSNFNLLYGAAGDVVTRDVLWGANRAYSLWTTGQGFVQSLSLVTEGAGRIFALGAASDILNALASDDAEIDIYEKQSPLKRRPARPVSRTTATDALVLASASLICRPNLRALTGAATVPLWSSLDALKEGICGTELSDDTIALSVPAALDRTPAEIVSSLKFTQDRELSNELRTDLNNLSSITVNQSAILNEIRRLGEESAWRSRLETLNSQIASAEAAAQAPSLWKVLGAIKEIGQAAELLGGGIGSSAKLLSDYSEAEDGPIGNYIYTNRDEFSKQTAKVFKGVKIFENTIDVFDSSARSAAGQQARVLRRKRRELQKAFDALLNKLRKDSGIP